MASLKRKGDLAELKVAADLIDRGCRISIPFGEDCDYDLIADYEDGSIGCRSNTRAQMVGSYLFAVSRSR